MAEFAYTARTPEGVFRSGMLVSGSVGEAVTDLKSRSWIVLDVQPAVPASTIDFWAWFNPAYWLPATRFDVEIGMNQLASMLRSGLTLLTALSTAADQVRRIQMRAVWRRVYERIEEGSTFADALKSEKSYFPPIVVHLMQVGESSGTLDTVTRQAAEHLERSRSLRTILLTALTYPVIVLMSAIGVTIFLVVSVIPKLQKFIIHQGHRRLPPITQALLDVTGWFNTNLLPILITLAVVLALIVVLYRIESTRLQMDRLVLRLPVVGGILRLAGTAAMARGMSLLLENGITLLDAVRITRGLLSNRAMQRRLDLARESVIEGRPFAETLLAGREFLPMLGRMTAVGETTGTLDGVLAEAARFHEAQLAGAVRRFSLLVEPIVILIVGGIVGFVYIAFFVALFSVAGGR